MMTLQEKLSHSTQNEVKQYFFNACAKNQLGDVIFMLNNNYKISIELDDFMAIRTSCMFGSIDVLKYFYKKENPQKPINIHIKNDAPFRMATRMGKYEILEYLIFEKNLNKTKEITDYLKKNPNKIVSSMFDARDMNKQLSFDFNQQPHKVKM